MGDDTLQQLNAINKWLDDVFGDGTRLSVLLREVGLSEGEIEHIKAYHLAGFLQAIVNQIVEMTEHHDGERRNSVMVRYYGLLNGKPETLHSIGDSLQLSRERIRQLIQKRIRLYRNAKRKVHLKMEIAALARRFLDTDGRKTGEG